MGFNSRLPTLKITLCGDYAVGKTSICRRFGGKRFKESYKPTVGVEISTQTIHLDGIDSKVRLQIWDMGGQSRFETVLPRYFKGAKGTLVVFDLTRKKSLKSVPKWIRKTRNEADSPSLILVGNKSDLEGLRSVDRSAAEELKNKHSLAGYIETSARKDHNIDKAFHKLIHAIIKQKRERKTQ